MIYGALIVLIFLAKIVLNRVPSLTAQRRKLYFVVTAFFLLFFVCAFRDASVGTDMESYLNKYILLSHHSLGDILTHFYSERVEIGFALLNKLLSYVIPFPQTIMVVSSLLICTGFAVFIYRYVENYFSAVLLFTCCGLYLYAFNATRQMIACAILINAWGLLTEKRLRLSLILFAVSLTFHVTSAIFVLAYLFYFLRDNKKAVTITMAIGAVLAANYRLLIRLASHFTNKFSYLNNSAKRISAGGIWTVWIIESVILLAYLAYYYMHDTGRGQTLLRRLPHPVVEMSTVESLCIPVFSALCIIFLVMGTGFNYMDRFGIYFMPFCILLLTNFGNRVREQSVTLGRLYTVAMHLCFVLYFVFFATALPHYNYSFVWG